MRYLSADGRWVALEDEVPHMPSSESLVDEGLLHPEMLGMASSDLLAGTGTWPLGGYVRLTDGPGGQARFASYYDVLMTNPWGYGTIHTIARGLARLPLKLYAADLEDKTEPGTNITIVHPNRNKGGVAGKIAWALRYPDAGGIIKDAAPSRRALWYGTVVNKLVHGNGIWEIIRDDGGSIIGFKLHPMEYVDVDEGKMIYNIHPPHYNQTTFDFSGLNRDQVQPEKVLTADKVCHFGLWESGRRPLNPSPVRALHTTVALYDAVSRHMVGFFNNGARVSGHLKVEPGLHPNAVETIRQEILKLYQGPQSAGKVLISSGEWQAFHREPQFDGIVNLIKFSRDEIFVVYGVPPPVMGVIERAIMANAREMRDQYVRDLIGPHAEFLAGDFEAQVIDREDAARQKNIVAYFDVDEQLRPDLWKRAAVFRNLLLAYTPEELRGIERQPPLPTEADPRGYSRTIQRPLNETALNNMPDYVLRDELNRRRFELEEERQAHDIEVDNRPEPEAPAPSDNEDENDSDD
jgi:HK97 family phage portal protein